MAADTGGQLSRRTVLRMAAAGGYAASQLSVPRLLFGGATLLRGAGRSVYALQDGWTFAGEDGAEAEPVHLPHCVARLSWQGWKPEVWERKWTYRCRFAAPASARSGDRSFLHFDGVMTGAQVVLNGRSLEPHVGGFLPFEREVTGDLRAENELSVTVDGGWLNAPPGGGPKGPPQIDYLLPAGIHRSVSLRVVPQTYLSDVFAKPVSVLDAGRRLEVESTIDAASTAAGPMRIEAKLSDGESVVGQATANVKVDGARQTKVRCTLDALHGVTLWSAEHPKLYTLRVSLHTSKEVVQEYATRVGFREARFEVDGFFFNGKKARIFGLNRHELFPYVGFAMPDRVMRHDAEMLRHQLNCNMVRCSHYPQTEAFLNACDELGLMVWQEVPGWQYIGDAAWQELLKRDLRSMIVRDRNHPSVVIWGVRVNESANNVPLYTETKAIAKSLDDSRPTTGTMTRYSTENWVQEVFAYDDYHEEADGSVAMHTPIPDVPFFFAEGVGQYQYEHGKGFKQYYRKAGDRKIQEAQARYHAEGHDRAARDPRCGGLIAWCAFDYASLLNGYNALKCPGVVDTFRIPKLGATFYASQVSPAIRPVIMPSFYWDFDAADEGPGTRSLIFSNCDRLMITIGTGTPVSLEPDKRGYPNLAYPPFAADLTVVKGTRPELRIQGFVGDKQVIERRMSSDRSKDKLVIESDDRQIFADDCDATRVWFAVCDVYGTPVIYVEGEVRVSLSGPGEIIGDESFVLSETGGVGALWIRSKGQREGVLTVSARHPRFGTEKVAVRVVQRGSVV